MRRLVKRISHHLSPKRLVHKRKTKGIVQDFAKKFGLVYFGGVSRSDEEYRIVRGLTVSNQHNDLHYCVGTYEGYDVSFVERSDMLKKAGATQVRAHRWHILEFDLLEAKGLPHVFVGMHSNSESFYLQLFNKFPHLRSVTLGMLGAHKSEFLHKYRVYTSPSDLLDVEALLSPLVTEMVSKHFGSLAIEIVDASLYVYSENTHLSAALLEAMLKNGNWLANHIDVTAQKLVNG
ncbi:MAG TPA: hypothetical protein VGE34_01410 [Candidatus Saccharimonadales bacterium]